MDVGVVTISDGDAHCRMAAAVAPGKASYCAHWGHEFYCLRGSLDAARPSAWSKVRAIQRVLDNHEWVLWTDADSVLWSPQSQLADYLRCPAETHLILQKDAQGINTGVFFMRNCEWSRRFLDLVYSQEQFLHHPWWEQAAVIELLNDPSVAAHARVYEVGERADSFHGFIGAATWEELFIHFPGIALPERVQLVENLARLADYPPERRLPRRDALGDLLNRLELFGQGVEVGVARGEFARRILDRWKGRTLHLVDPWRRLNDYVDIANVSDEAHVENLRATLSALAPHSGRFTIHRRCSNEAAASFADNVLDFVYIDANHDYDAVSGDIRAWYPKIRPGGIIAGHDFLDGERPEGRFGVRTAVEEFEKEKGFRVAVTTEPDWPSWYAIKPRSG